MLNMSNELSMLNALLIILFIYVVPHLPLWATDAIGSVLARLMKLSRNGLYQTSKINLKLTHSQLNDLEIETLTIKSLKRTISNFFEMPLIWKATDQWIRKKITAVCGEEILMAALKANAGVILIVPHTGNWEILGRHSSQYAPMTSLYKKQKHKAIEDFIKHGREASGSTLVPTNSRGVAALLKALKRNELTAILPDHVPTKNSGIFVPFFGQEAYTMTLVHQLIKRTQCRVVVGCALRVKKGFELTYQEPDSAIYDSDETISVAALNQIIEKIVCQDISQYQWGYKRFKKVPKDHPRHYKS